MNALRKLLAIPVAVLVIAWAGAVGAEDAPDQVNVNTADAQTIARVLNGVGLKKAQAIVSYRETHGRFDAPADLAKVKGIGQATVDRNADRILISEAEAEPVKTDDERPSPG